ncbi:translation initiation factor IF-2 [Mycoplasma sp. 744]|uniref:translation initiation factor IF-2 n=1 Tax=Mycoplasma sp. 744 TaxID=3108531 RepID=UPI002B1D9F33|nr:translation initiation factor IF-2 [Mycoplasma sp. 744]MEA4115228.1 translation initiation factor IF-2 [Mycoplasma sp. 744]
MSKLKRKTNDQEIKNSLLNIKTEIKDGIFIFTNKMSVSDLAKKINVNTNDILKKFFLKGQLFTINHILEEEQIAEICLDYGLDFRKEENVDAGNFLNNIIFDDKPEELTKRTPVVTVMGHVDHGKTTLIDYIRKTKVTQTESSGITQHTGAYQATHKGEKITFIDTPGHEAFKEMRSRGAKITDIIVLVVACDDGVMPQTKEAINHAHSASVPMIVFVNKMDKPSKNIDRIKRELLENDVVLEEFGGDVPVVYGSALTGDGINDLLGQILLHTDIFDLKANANRYPFGTIIESKIDRGIGTLATLIVENGTIEKGDFIIAGASYGRVKMMIDPSNMQQINKGLPGTPVIISGLNYPPQAGERFIGVFDEKLAKKLANEKAQMDRNSILSNKAMKNIEEGKKIINIIIRSDVQGTAEALENSLKHLQNEEVKVHIVSSSAGQVSNKDLLLAQAANAIILTFNNKPSSIIKQLAKQQDVIMMSHSVVYQAMEEIQKLLDSKKTIIYEEKLIGSARVDKIFKFSKVGIIAGSIMNDGIVKLGCKVKVYRNKKLIHEGFIETLQREKNEVKEVGNGKDFGTHLRKYNDIMIDDIFEFYEDVEVK